MSVKRWRKIIVDGEEWRYLIGKTQAQARHIDGRHFVSTPWEVKGIDEFAFERGQEKGTSYGTVRPLEISVWIRKEAAQ